MDLIWFYWIIVLAIICVLLFSNREILDKNEIQTE